ncbi:MAG: HDIG domain-containing protein [Candidatus Omnitrophica bacterium]|nr:HDIG domain-containing protein [Candidatus Omnitrophota bacterium]
MKVSTKQKIDRFVSVIVPIIFFAFTGFTFYFAPTQVNFSPLLVLAVLYLYAYSYRKIENLPHYLDLLLLVTIIMVTFFSITLIPSSIGHFSNSEVNILKVSVLGISSIGFAMIITLLFNSLELSLVFSVFLALLGIAMEGGSLSIGASLFCGSLFSSLMSHRIRRRSQIIKAGFFSVLVFFIAYILECSQSLFLMSSISLSFLKSTVLIGFFSSIIMMFVLPIIVPGILYFFEIIFKVVTDVSLLEFSDFNHPLMRRLILEAPGTYQHSLVVANLSEAAAESISANSLLARVGSYYHDIGKILKPNYFVENLVTFKDVHKGLKPSMSKLIIVNHVKDGIELGKKYRLNPRIIDFIGQHHGRNLVYYFYQKALELEPHGKHEEEYRYPGPRPQNKEIAIVSLADTIEALSRTMDEPTPARIEEMVRGIVRKRFMEGELDESNLTLKELEKITQSFIRMLCAVFHARIDYPRDDARKPAETKKNKS